MPALKPVAKWVLALLFVAAGVNHFVSPDFYVKIMPPYLPWHYELVLVSGVFEILGGVGLLVPRLQRAAAWGLIALLVAVFPANVHMALNPDAFPNIPPAALWARLPFQALLIAWAYWFTRR
ncbi:DoxX family protein [Gemmata sp. JC717]|uniref:DoxX family protein n=1 Tax=Gemmata algarum TaxID=2975278 RepID=A0ABU5F759_9BACT|nr:DoxX family protein [Gemmata algarum]MDY3553240.1 DoxX family protein [Gemmata algarum]MDY3563433.1 DoxX family protein [Gemmata algarum]